MPRNKASEYVRVYGVETCNLGIEKLLGETQKGGDINSINGCLVYCNDHQILVLLVRHEARKTLTDELEINMLRCLKDPLVQYN